MIRMGRASSLSRNSGFMYASGVCAIGRQCIIDGMYGLVDRRVLVTGCALAALLTLQPAAQSSSTPPTHAKAVRRLVIQNAMIIYGNAKPPFGPMDVVVQDGLITDILPSSSTAALAARGA